MLHDMGSVKTIGSSGQIALGKQHAGRHVLVDEVEPGVWLVKLGEFVPDAERWLHAPKVKADLDEAVAWAEAHPPRASRIERLAKKLQR